MMMKKFAVLMVLLASQMPIVAATLSPTAYARQVLMPPGQIHIKKALFPPDDDVETILIGIIDAELYRIRSCIYAFSNPRVAKSIIDAHK